MQPGVKLAGKETSQAFVWTGRLMNRLFRKWEGTDNMADGYKVVDMAGKVGFVP